ncbi:hypothetical protein BC941DRAFT_487612 [Chlamydoabsidia padenii]|nr:hypothetical protein BC941DRAFT_487612 [Chlamydoabsidia padenii]
MLVKTLLLAALGVVGTTAQLTNSTLLAILNTTQLSPSPKFIQLLQSSPDYKPVLDLLSQPGNITLFVPSDAVFDRLIQEFQETQQSQGGGGGGSGDQSNNTTGSSGTSGGTDGTNVTMPAMAAAGGGGNDTIPGSGGASNSTENGGGSSNSTENGGGSSNSTTGGGSSNSTTGGGSGNDTQQSSGQSVFPQGFTIFSNFSVVDILNYHILQEKVLLHNQANQTVLLNSMLTNQTADKFGYGMPFILNSNTTLQNSSSIDSGNGTSSGGNNTSPDGGSSGNNSTTPTSGGTGNSTGGDAGLAPQAASWISRIKQLMDAQSSSSGGGGSAQSGGNSSNTTVYWIGNGISNANVTIYDIEASNGVLHVIDNVLIPPGNVTNVFSNISDASTLSEMIEGNPEVGQALDSVSNVTIFAPNDKGLCMVCIDQLGQDKWKGLIMNHVVQGIYYTSNLTSTGGGSSPLNLTTQAGETIPITSNSSGITLNDTIQIVRPNILFNGGVIHLIDKIIEPPQNSTVTNNGTAAGPSQTSSAPVAASSTVQVEPSPSTTETTGAQETTQSNPPQTPPTENPVGVEQPSTPEDPPPRPAFDNPFPPTYL